MRTLTLAEKIYFECLCSDRCIDPSIALESDAVLKAIDAGDTQALIEALDNEF